MVEGRKDSLQKTFAEIDERMRTQFHEEEQINKALGIVTPRQRYIFRLRLGLMPQVNEGQPWSRKRVGKYLHLKPSVIGSVERRGLRTLHAVRFSEQPIIKPGSLAWKLREKMANPPDFSSPEKQQELRDLEEDLKQPPGMSG